MEIHISCCKVVAILFIIPNSRDTNLLIKQCRLGRLKQRKTLSRRGSTLSIFTTSLKWHQWPDKWHLIGNILHLKLMSLIQPILVGKISGNMNWCHLFDHWCHLFGHTYHLFSHWCHGSHLFSHRPHLFGHWCHLISIDVTYSASDFTYLANYEWP